MTTGEQLIVELRAALEQLIGDLQSVTEDYTAAQKGLAQMESALAVEKAAREKAEAVANEPCANCGFPTEDVIGQPKVTERLAAAQKRIETLKGALRRVRDNRVVHPRVQHMQDAYLLDIIDAALASPPESAPPKDQGAGAAPPAAPPLDRDRERIAYRQADMEALVAAETELECIDDVVSGARPPEDFEPATGTLGRVIRALAAGGVPSPALACEPCTELADERGQIAVTCVHTKERQPAAGPTPPALAQPPAPQRHPSAPNPETFFRQAVALLPKVAGSLTADQKCGVISDALGRAYADGWNACLAAQPPAPQEGLFENETFIEYLRRNFPPPAEPSAPQAVAAPQVTQEQLSGAGHDDRLCCEDAWTDRGGEKHSCQLPHRHTGPHFDSAHAASWTDAEHHAPAPPAPVSAPQDNENQLSGKGK